MVVIIIFKYVPSNYYCYILYLSHYAFKIKKLRVESNPVANISHDLFNFKLKHDFVIFFMVGKSYKKLSYSRKLIHLSTLNIRSDINPKLI